MCGIGGFQGSFEAGILPAMRALLQHRGPDHQAITHDAAAGVGLVHTRLSIIDLSARSNQPLWDGTGRYCIVFNGEIYNYRELRRELLAEGASFVSDGDAEVILNLYIRHGQASLRRLNGIFAFALWDKLAGELLLVRDQFGVKPLYYALTPRGLVFASELKAVLCARDVPRDLDYTALWQYLTFLWAPAPRTPLAAVRKVEPGEFVRVRAGQIIARGQFMAYPPFTPPPADFDATRAGAQVRTLFEQAVRRQLVADVPVGAFLSGGLDSSAIAAVAARELGAGLRCFTIELEGDASDEIGADLPFARLLAQQLQIPLEIARVTPRVMDDLPRMLFALDEPQGDPAPLASMYMSERARQCGIRVMLSGAGGDDLFAGYRRHYALAQEAYWDWIPTAGRRVVAGLVSTLPTANGTLRRVRKALSYAALTAPERLSSYFFWIDPLRSLALFSVGGRERIGAGAVDEPLRRALGDPAVRGADPLSQMLFLEQKFFLVDHNFNYVDKTGMSAGVEIRVPFLDPDLVRCANALPSEGKLHKGVNKLVLRQALAELLPESILRRPKVGFGAPLRSWLRGPLRPWVDEMLGERVIRQRGIFEPDAVARLVQADGLHRIDASYTIFAMICVEIWARQFLDPVIPTPTV